MRVARRTIHAKSRTIPAIKFEDQELTSFGGLVIFQKLFQELDLEGKLQQCFDPLDRRMSRFYKFHKVFMCLIVLVSGKFSDRFLFAWRVCLTA